MGGIMFSPVAPVVIRMSPALKPKVLFLPAWYPHRYDAMAGLFVQQHALAVKPFADVAVLQIVQHPEVKHHLIEEKTEEGIFIFRIYLKSVKVPLLGKLINGLNYRWSTKYAYEQVKKKWGTPDLCHVHILTRAGWLALRLWKQSKIPYLISEHWSRYFPENSESYKGNTRKKYTGKVVEHAAAVLPVSEVLKKAMVTVGLKHNHYQVIPNVVDSEKFTLKPSRTDGGSTCFIHVSCFDEKSKNIIGLIEAFKQLLKEHPQITLKLIGDGPDKVTTEDYVKQLGLSGKITFTGELTGEALVQAYHLADALVLSSHYETFAVVLVEAMACGLPVISTPVGVAPELIKKETGVLTASSKAEDIKKGLEIFLRTKNTFSPDKIRNSVINRFSKETVGKALADIYTKVLTS